MEEQRLKQANRPERDSHGIVSELLRGRQEPNVRQVRALAKPTGVLPEGFLWAEPLQGYCREDRDFSQEYLSVARSVPNVPARGSSTPKKF